MSRGPDRAPASDKRPRLWVEVAEGRVASAILGNGFLGECVELGAEVTLCGPPTMVPGALERLGVKVEHDLARAVADADLVLWDPAAIGTISAATHHHRCDRSIYEGFEVQGFTETVLSRGRVIVEDTNLVTKGGGQFIKRARTGELLR